MNEEEQFKMAIGSTLNEVDHFYRIGLISQETYELYCLMWRNGRTRFSTMLETYELQKDLKRSLIDSYGFYIKGVITFEEFKINIALITSLK